MDLDLTLERRERWSAPEGARVLAQGAAMLVFLSYADRIIVRQPFLGQTFWAAFDVLVHGAVALAVAEPCVRRVASRKQALVLIGLAFLSATALDVDHFVSAGTLEVGAVLSLAARPPTHSLTFALLIGALTALLSRDRVAGWVAFAAIASHVLRDAAMGTAPLLWPLPIDAVPRWVYGCGEIGLLLVSGGWGEKVPGTCGLSKEILSVPDSLVLRWDRWRKCRAPARPDGLVFQ